VKIYTRTGDDGTTGVLGRERLPKSDPRIEAYGSVDELNAVLGLARTHADGTTATELEAIQRRLFQVGAELATTDAAMLAKLTRIQEDAVQDLEALIDRIEADLPPLKSFILPAGAVLAAHLHVARAVCRRAERRVVALMRTTSIEPRIARYLNRLADLLFVMARAGNRRAGVADVEWHP
jgi:cob(I)alamin adenosyltransferase